MFPILLGTGHASEGCMEQRTFQLSLAARVGHQENRMEWGRTLQTSEQRGKSIRRERAGRGTDLSAGAHSELELLGRKPATEKIITWELKPQTPTQWFQVLTCLNSWRETLPLLLWHERHQHSSFLGQVFLSPLADERPKDSSFLYLSCSNFQQGF